MDGSGVSYIIKMDQLKSKPASTVIKRETLLVTLFLKIKLWFILRKKIKMLKKQDPYIYK